MNESNYIESKKRLSEGGKVLLGCCLIAVTSCLCASAMLARSFIPSYSCSGKELIIDQGSIGSLVVRADTMSAATIGGFSFPVYGGSGRINLAADMANQTSYPEVEIDINNPGQMPPYNPYFYKMYPEINFSTELNACSGNP